MNLKKNKKIRVARVPRVANRRHGITSNYNKKTVPSIIIHNHIYQTKRLDRPKQLKRVDKPMQSKNVYSKAHGVDATTQTEVQTPQGFEGEKEDDVISQLDEYDVTDDIMNDNDDSTVIVHDKKKRKTMGERVNRFQGDSSEKKYSVENLKGFTVPILRQMMRTRGTAPNKRKRSEIVEFLTEYFEKH